MINYIILGLAIVFESGALYFAWKEFRKVQHNRSFYSTVRALKDPVTFVVLFEDSAALLGLVVALIGIWLGQVTGIHMFRRDCLCHHRSDSWTHCCLAGLRNEGSSYQRKC